MTDRKQFTKKKKITNNAHQQQTFFRNGKIAGRIHVFHKASNRRKAEREMHTRSKHLWSTPCTTKMLKWHFKSSHCWRTIQNFIHSGFDLQPPTSKLGSTLEIGTKKKRRIKNETENAYRLWTFCQKTKDKFKLFADNSKKILILITNIPKKKKRHTSWLTN